MHLYAWSYVVTDKGGWLVMVSQKSNSLKSLTRKNYSNHLKSALGVKSSSFRSVMMPHGVSRVPSEFTSLMPLLTTRATINLNTQNARTMWETGTVIQIVAQFDNNQTYDITEVKSQIIKSHYSTHKISESMILKSINRFIHILITFIKSFHYDLVTKMLK